MIVTVVAVHVMQVSIERDNRCGRHGGPPRVPHPGPWGVTALRIGRIASFAKGGILFCKCLLNFRSNIACRVVVASRVRTTLVRSAGRGLANGIVSGLPISPNWQRSRTKVLTSLKWNGTHFKKYPATMASMVAKRVVRSTSFDCFKYPKQIVSSSRPSSSDAFGLQHCLSGYFPDCDYILLSRCVPYEGHAIAVVQGHGLSFSTKVNERSGPHLTRGIIYNSLGPARSLTFVENERPCPCTTAIACPWSGTHRLSRNLIAIGVVFGQAMLTRMRHWMTDAINYRGIGYLKQ